MKKVFLIVLISVFMSNIFAQGTAGNSSFNKQKPFDLSEYGVKIEPDKRLIVVMAALEYAGIKIALSDTGKEFSKTLTADLAADENLRQKMKAFFDSYKSRNPDAKLDELIAPFVSLAYALSPDLSEPARSTDLPADLLEVLDFAPLAREFYKKTNFESKVSEYLKTYQTEGDIMLPSANEMVADLLAYLNTKPQTISFERIKVEIPNPKNPKKKVAGIKTIEHERRFFIVPDLLATAGTVNFRNIGDDYYAIVPPKTNFRISEARRAFLQFIIDPLILKNGKEISTFRPQIKGLLDERRKANPDISPDVFLATMRSLVAAIDAKQLESQKIQAATDLARRRIDLAKTPDAKKAVSAQLEQDKKNYADETALELSQAYERGAVLAFYFAEQLNGVENSGFSIDGSLRDMILSLDTSKEKDRLAQNVEARKRGVAVREERKKKASENLVKNEQASARSKELKAKLEEIEPLIKNKEFGEADSRLNKLQDEFPGESSIFYALGRVASLSAATTTSGGSGTFDEGLRDKRLNDAKAHYVNAINSANENTDKALLQLTYFALGRIYEFYDNSDYAMQIYRKAASYGTVVGGAYNESMAAIARLSTPKKP